MKAPLRTPKVVVALFTYPSKNHDPIPHAITTVSAKYKVSSVLSYVRMFCRTENIKSESRATITPDIARDILLLVIGKIILSTDDTNEVMSMATILSKMPCSRKGQRR